MNDRIVITGIGIIDPLGYNREECYSNLINDYNPIKAITKIDFEQFHNIKTRIAAEVSLLKCNTSDPNIHKSGPYIQLGRYAVEQALESAGHPELISKNGAVVFSTLGATGNTRIWFSLAVIENRRRYSPRDILENMQDYIAGYIASSFQLTGLSTGMNSACSTGIVNIDIARRLLDVHDFAIVGGSDCMVDALHMSTFQSLQALSYDSSIPFSSDRSGFVMGEGAGCLIIEKESNAIKRGANILAYIDGIGVSNDSYSVTSPDPEGRGAERVMNMALCEAGNPSVDFVSAHATGTPIGDEVEYKIIKKILPNTPIYSSKGKIGHTMAGSGIIELIHGIGVLENGIIPRTFNLKNTIAPDDDNLLINNLHKDCSKFIKNSFGFGGRCASIVISKV